MAIRKADAPVSPSKVAKQQPISQDPLPELKGRIDHALKDGNFSQKEARDLEAALGGSPASKQAVGQYLTEQLEARSKAGHPIAISEMALSQLGRTLGLDLKELFFRRQAVSKAAEHEVGAGLEKTASTVDSKTASDTRLEQQKAIRDSHAGVVDRPIGGAKGAAYDAGAEARRVLAEHVEGKLVGKLGVEGRAAYGELRAPVLKTGTAVVEEMKRAGTLDKLGAAAAQVGKPGFKDALSTAAGAMSEDIVKATNMTAVNVPAVEAVVNGTESAVGALTSVTKGTALEQVVATHGPKLAKSAAALGAKLGAKAASTAGAAASTASAAGTAAQAATAGAQAATAGAEAAGQAVPVLGQALGVVTTGLAAAEFIGHCRHQPKDWKRIVANGANVVGQAVGIFIPFVGAAVTAGKLAADAALNAHDKKLGKEPPAVGVKDLAPHVASATGLAAPFLESAGYADAAARLRGYTAQVEELADKGVTSGDLAKMDAAEREAMMQTLAACHQELEKAAPEAKGTPAEASAVLLGQAFQGLMAAWRKSKNAPTAADPEAEAKKLDGDAMKAAGEAAAARAFADAGVTGAV